MKRSTDRILTTHVGSLVRPPEVVAGMRARENGLPYEEDAFAQDLRAAVADVVRTQTTIGIDVPSDGEFGKRGWYQYLSERLAGLEYSDAPDTSAQYPSRDRTRFPEFYEMYERMERTLWMPPAAGDGSRLPGRRPGRWVCTGPVRYQGQEAVRRDIENFKAALGSVEAEEAFMPVVAPCTAEMLQANHYYPREEDYLFAVADALKEEYHAIVDAGLLLQVDDALLPSQYARMAPDASLADYKRWAEPRIEALNHALVGIPPEKVRYHICWGSQNVPHTADVPLRDIVDILLKAKVAGHSIEAANPRHEHEWRVWQDVRLPDGKVLIPGFVSHATNIVEHPELVAWRIGNFASVVGRENVIASTDCGFAQNWAVRRVHPSIQWAKLEALVAGARLASQQLWGRAD